MLLTLRTRLLSLVTTAISLGIVVAGIATQPVMSLFCGSISSTSAWILSLGAFYYGYGVGLGGYLIGGALACVVCGLAGSPLNLIKLLLGPKQPEPQVKMVKVKEASVKPKKGLVATTLWAITRRFFRLIFLVLGILDTIIHTSFLEKEKRGATKEDRNWFWNQLYEKDEDYYDYEQVYGGEVQNDHPEELWIFCNGIMNELDDAKRVCKKITELFGRPCKLLHNPTDGIILDLLECLMGKTGLFKLGCTGPRRLLRKKLGMEMEKDCYKKIVLVAHSQGTIISGNVIADFNDRIEDKEKYTEEEREVMKMNMSKLEVYIFAGAAHYMSGKYVSHLECLSNRGDVIAVCGHVFPKILKFLWRNTRGNGIIYDDHCKDHVETSNWGHLLIPHYLASLENGCFSGSKLATEYWLKNPQKKNESETSPLIPK
ncbi:hypothetical protein QTG54_010794 [Skeletonema marinoi]|uniref:Uncharacterized protein n=1 Tax=Skeletonema marinoi TaxID=267567 RepID=A0AAD9DAC6_9STRA|nr:hypothetical protein QTG54_010794 [Skeletonema marinoi]